VKNTHSKFFDLRNYLVTAPDIAGPWSDPVFLNASGFDPSLFIDTDGRFYVANLEWDFRAGYEHPGAIVLQELDRLRICDEHARSFAGAFVGICCQDFRGTRIPAWFDYFSYAGRDPAASTERRRPTLLT